MSRTDITGIHHVGLIVHDMARALSTFKRLGFDVKPPAFAALPPSPGQAPQPIGASNSHADFPRNFVELVGIAPQSRERLPQGAKLIPLDIPEDRLAATTAAMRATVANISARLALGQGAHILVFASHDAERTARRLADAGVGHGGARAAQRPIATADGVELAEIKYLELNDDDPHASPGLVAEGRIGVAEDAPAELLDAQVGLSHPNGAVGLVECVLVTDEEGFAATVDRYRRYLGVAPAVADESAVFALDTGRVVVTTGDGFAKEYPGQTVPPWRRGEGTATPAAESGREARLGAYTVEVADLAATERFLGAHGVELGRRADGRPFIPADVALGTVIVFQ